MEGEEDILREKLAELGISIPAEAEFIYEGNGWHSFTAVPSPGEAETISGTLRCNYLENGVIGDIENSMVTLTPYREEDVITSKEAYERLQKGKFQGAEGLARLEPPAVTVLSCNLAYRADTKGYYQPVYEFLVDFTAPDFPGLTTGIYIIPAMK